MATITNPFFVGGAVPPAHFVGRSAEISEIFSHIGNKSHLAIHGSPGLGKSSLLSAVERPETWQTRGLDPSVATVVSLNCGDFSPFTRQAFWRSVLERLDNTGDAGLQQLVTAGLNKSAPGRDDLQKVLAFLMKQSRLLVMLLDDFDAALRPGENHSENDVLKMKADLRALCNEFGTKCLSQIVTSFHRLTDLGPELLPTGSPWYNQYLFLPLKPFTDEDAGTLFDRMSPAWSLTQAQRDWIRELTDGHPALLQNACYLLWKSFQEKTQLEPWQFADRLRGLTRQFFRDEWQFSNREERMALLLIALCRADGKVPGREYNLSGIDTVLTQMRDKMFGLKDRGIVEERMEGAKPVFRFRSSLMEWFVIQDLQDAKDEKELAERQEVLFGLSNKQVDKVKGAMSLMWKHKDAVTALVKFSGRLAGAFSKGFSGSA